MSNVSPLSLEAYVLWNYGLHLASPEQIASGNIPKRNYLTPDQFNTVVSYFEPYRKGIEDLMQRFNGSGWSGHGESHSDFIPDSVFVSAEVYTESLFKKEE